MDHNRKYLEGEKEMLEYKGEYGTAKVMIDIIDESTVSQIYEFLNHELFVNHIAIMPDCHYGKGAVIGFTMKLSDKIIPNIVGVDIGCGMLSNNIGKNLFAEITKPELDEEIRRMVPFGTGVHRDVRFNEDKYNPFWERANNKLVKFIQKFNEVYNTHYEVEVFNKEWLENKCGQIGMDYERAIRSVGTLGSGNHFIEMNKSANTGDYWVTVHSGSRQLGYKIAEYWQKKAGKGYLSYLEGEDMFGYLVDMLFAQQYADENRDIMQNLIHLVTELEVSEEITSVHNFIDFDDFIIRKGAIRSYENEKMIIPFNMEDGILICEGKSNKEWNYSAPHGAGRVASRRWAKDNLSNSDAEKRMKDKGIYFSTLPTDELKGAYKDPKIIEESIGPTAEIIDRLIPAIAMKDKMRGRKK